MDIKPRTRALNDLLVIFILSIFVFIVTFLVHPFEFLSWAITELGPFHELIYVLIFLTIASTIFSMRRLKELRIETAKRMRAEDAFIEKSRALDAFFKNTIAPLALLDKDFNFIHVNEAYAKSAQRDVSDFPGHNHFEFYPSDAKAIFEQVVKTKEVFQTIARPFTYADHPEWGVTYWDWTLTPILDKTGEVGFLVLSLNNVTERKRAEEKTAQLIIELRRSNAELEQFAHLAAHDLQEPLRMVACYVQMLKQRYKGRLDAEADEFIAYAADGAEHMSGMVNDLLLYSSLDKHFKPFQPADCQVMLEKACSNLKAAIAESGAEITHDPMPVVAADETHLVQVFQQLLENAIKFRSDEKPRIHISAVQKGKEWVFSVRDNGIGIEPEYFERIFIIFQRLHARKKYPGTGIGLATCKKIIDHHGGRIWVESKPGEGSKFYFTLPVGRDGGNG